MFSSVGVFAPHSAPKSRFVCLIRGAEVYSDWGSENVQAFALS